MALRQGSKELTIPELNDALRMANHLRDFETDEMNRTGDDDRRDSSYHGKPKAEAFVPTASSVLSYLEGWGITFDWMTRRWNRALAIAVREASQLEGS